MPEMAETKQDWEDLVHIGKKKNLQEILLFFHHYFKIKIILLIWTTNKELYSNLQLLFLTSQTNQPLEEIRCCFPGHPLAGGEEKARAC